MTDVILGDRRASRAEVAGERAALRGAAEAIGLSALRLLTDGTVVVHAADDGYRLVAQFAAAAAAVVGTYVHVITDDVPAVTGVADLPPL